MIFPQLKSRYKARFTNKQYFCNLRSRKLSFEKQAVLQQSLQTQFSKLENVPKEVLHFLVEQLASRFGP